MIRAFSIISMVAVIALVLGAPPWAIYFCGLAAVLIVVLQGDNK